MTTQARLHGDPRHHADDISKLKAENDRLRGEVERLTGELRRVNTRDCASVLTFGEQRYACDGLAGHTGPHGGVYPNPVAGGNDVFVQWSA